MFTVFLLKYYDLQTLALIESITSTVSIVTIDNIVYWVFNSSNDETSVSSMNNFI